MFNNLKEKLKKVFSNISQKVKKETEEEVKEEVKKIEEIEEKKEEKPKKFLEKIKEKIITRKISGKEFDNIFNDLEFTLLENNVAVEVIDKIKEDLKKELLEKNIKRTEIEKTIKDSLKNTIKNLFKKLDFDLLLEIKSKEEKPYIILFVGVNGAGKTTTIAKIAKILKDNKISCVLAASDTFRAASIEQLEEHGKKLGIKVIKHSYGSDPAAVAFDAIKHAKAHKIDVVLIDTAGRQHTNINLIDEMKKIVRVTKPDLKVFVGEAITGNDCIEQASTFNEAVNLDGIILAKADVDEKGGATISTSYVTKKPILYLGTGQKYNDLEKFDENKIIKSLGL